MNEQLCPPAKRYHRIKNRLFLISLSANLLFLVILLFSGLSPQLRNLAIALFPNFFLTSGFYILVFCAAFFVVNFPLDLYEGFILEHKFGLSNQSFLNWLNDGLKKAALNLILVLIITQALYFCLHKFQDYWWFLVAAFWLFLTLILAKITPAVIIPLFYKYLPISDAGLRQRILDLFDKCNIKIREVSSINFSAKTKKANAFVTGLGKNKRVVLSDTLLAEFSPEEIEGVLAHELGHYLKHDILKLILVNSVFTFVGFYVTDKILKVLLASFGLKGIDDIAFFPVIALSLTLLGLLILPVQNSFSRFLEKRADGFSLQLTKDKAAFISMMEKLGRMNLADPAPSRMAEIWLYDHPPIAKRIKFAQETKL